MKMSTKKLKYSGFTLLEMMIVLSIFSLIATVVAMLFTRGSSAYRHGESRIEMQRSSRYVTGRLAPYIGSAFTASPPGSPPILAPASTNTPNIGFVRFNTTEDWLSPDYPDSATSATMAASTHGLGLFRYEIRLGDVDNPSDDQTIYLNRLAPNNAVLDRQVLRRPRQDERLLTADDDPDKAFRFTQVRPNLLLLEFTLRRTTRGDANQPMDVDEDVRVTFNIPFKEV